MLPTPPAKRGFSLVELSIVLVIVGLLAGGVLTGQTLIRAAELRAVASEYQRYVAASNTFRDKYFSLPGDMPNATQFWGAMGGVGCATQRFNNLPTPPGTCNGNGDGILQANSGGSQPHNETFGFWQHLALASLIEGTYWGMADNGNYNDSGVEFDFNAPRSKLSGAGWSIVMNGTNSLANPEVTIANFYWIEGSYANPLLFGGEITNSNNRAPILRPEEAWNIDIKLDDGLAGKGKIVVYEEVIYNCATAPNGTLVSPSITVARDDSIYNLTHNGASCVIVFKKPFH